MRVEISTGSERARGRAVTRPGQGPLALGDWNGHGLCVGMDPEEFFPSNGAPATEARRICSACAVRSECLEYATAADEFGIWGGLDQQERRNLRRRHRWQASTARPAGNTAAQGLA